MYLDANIITFAGFDRGLMGDRARALLKEIMKGKIAATSSLALNECMWAAIKQKKGSELRAVIDGIYAIRNLDIKPVSSFVPRRAMSIMEETGLKPRDAFHVAVMEEFGIKEIVSNDADFDKVTWIKRIEI